ncbi:NAD(P)H-binding protein [Aquimarina sp. M1]
MHKQISILGTGWLGLPLANVLLEEKHKIKGSTTSEDKLAYLKNNGIEPYLLELKEEGPSDQIDFFLSSSEILIINIPPGLRRNPESNFVSKIQNLIPSIEQSTVKKVLYISSTSVFEDQQSFPLITSESIPNASSNSGKQLIETEQILQNHQKFNTTILRFAGLFDARRHPATMISKRKNIKNPLAPVNLIHREDCIGIINRIIKKNLWNEVFNASYPDHPKKAEYYSTICKKMGLSIPDYDFESSSKGKTIDSNRLIKELQYRFITGLY